MSKRSQRKQWKGSPKRRSKSRTRSQSRDARIVGDESRDPGAGGNDSSTQQSVHPKGLPSLLEWIPQVGSDFPAHLSLTDKQAFTLWVESYPYETESWEVKALSFLPDYVHVATKVITKVLWAMVYVLKGGLLPCPDSLAQELQQMDPVLCQPPDSAHPIKITFNEDLHSRARESWEEILSWVQYWWEAGYTFRNPQLFYGRNLRTDSALVLFVLYHINRVLPEGKPIRLEALLANTGWDHAHMMLQETNPQEVHH